MGVFFVIEMVLAHADLARLRFAHSPARELILSLRVLQDTRNDPVYGGWLSSARQRLGGVDVDLLTALAPTGPLIPDFFPELTRPWGILEEELVMVAATPPAQVRAELEYVAQGKPLPEPLRPLYADPVRHLPGVVEEMHKYWKAVLEPDWPRIRALVMAELFDRTEQFAWGGLSQVLANLHPEVSFSNGEIHVDKPHHCRNRYDLDGTGVVLVPSVFIWPKLMIQCCQAKQPSITFPPRGIAELWRVDSEIHMDPLFALVGKTRAVLLASLNLPRTTTQLARHLDLSPASVSQHLKILKATGLASSRRRGRLVLYQRTAAATALLSAASDE